VKVPTVITDDSSGLGENTARLIEPNGAKMVVGAKRKDRIDAHGAGLQRR
jgi:NADP-dependent 3-hydroxy acid dehydrogenase YdfG